MKKTLILFAFLIAGLSLAFGQSPKVLVTQNLKALASGKKDAFISSFNIGMPPTAKAWVRDTLVFFKAGGELSLGNFEIQDLMAIRAGGNTYQGVVVKTSRPVKRRLPYDVSGYKAMKAQLGRVSGYKANPGKYMLFLTGKEGGKPFLIFPSRNLKAAMKR